VAPGVPESARRHLFSGAFTLVKDPSTRVGAPVGGRVSPNSWLVFRVTVVEILSP